MPSLELFFRSAGLRQSDLIADPKQFALFGARHASICGKAIVMVEAFDGGPVRKDGAAFFGELL